MMLKKKTLHWFSDPSHGWLKVKKVELLKLRIADKISTYSYTRGDFVYLEEDMDATTYLKAFIASRFKGEMAYDEVFTFKESTSNKQSKIRSYNRYVAAQYVLTGALP